MLDHDLENFTEISAKRWVERVAVFVGARLNVDESEESGDELVVLLTSIFFFFFDDFNWKLFFLVVIYFLELIFWNRVGAVGSGVSRRTFSEDVVVVIFDFYFVVDFFLFLEFEFF